MYFSGVKEEESNENMLLKTVGKFIMTLLIKFWIWIVASTLFAVAITGERMTGFRIVYMALFLFFVLSFQVRI